MPKYAAFDPNVADPKPVIGWYDTDAITYPNLPPQNALLVLNGSQWAAHYAGFYAVSGGVLIPYTPAPVVTVQTTLQGKITAGIAITCDSNSSLNSTYALDETTMNQVGSVARDFAAGLGLPGGLPVFVYPDVNGVPRQLTGAQVVGLYTAQRNLLFALNTQAAIASNGGTPSWPSQTAEIA